MSTLQACENEDCEEYGGDKLTDARRIRTLDGDGACIECLEPLALWVFRAWSEDHPADRYAPEGMADRPLSRFREGFDAYTHGEDRADCPYNDGRRLYWLKGFDAAADRLGPRSQDFSRHPPVPEGGD